MKFGDYPSSRVGGIRHGACLPKACPQNVENRGEQGGTVITLRIRGFMVK